MKQNHNHPPPPPTHTHTPPVLNMWLFIASWTILVFYLHTSDIFLVVFRHIFRTTPPPPKKRRTRKIWFDFDFSVMEITSDIIRRIYFLAAKSCVSCEIFLSVNCSLITIKNKYILFPILQSNWTLNYIYL